MKKVAFITGITGQDGSYLAELLLSLGYEVHGLRRRSSTDNLQRLRNVFANEKWKARFYLHYGDLTDSINISRLIREIRPGEVYNLGAQSHVRVSFDCPEYTANADAIGTLRILEAVMELESDRPVKVCQASTSEMFGKVDVEFLNEETPFHPRSPYSVAKLYAYWIAINYRESFNLHVSNAIMFNHESPRRATSFVTRKITNGFAQLFAKKLDCLVLGNLDAVRDWGHAKDYVMGLYKLQQQDQPGDFVFATGTCFSVREFISAAATFLGLKVSWSGEGIDEIGTVESFDKTRLMELGYTDLDISHINVGQIIIRIDPYYFRPAEVDYLRGDATKARDILDWKPTVNFEELVAEMLLFDLRIELDGLGGIEC